MRVKDAKRYALAAHHAMVVGFLAFLVSSTSSRALAQTVDCNADFYPGRVLVRFKAGTTTQQKQTARSASGATEVLKEFPGIEGLELVRVTVGQEQAAAVSFMADSNVLRSSPDYLLQLTNEPDDTSITQLWAMKNTSQVLCNCESSCLTLDECTAINCVGCIDCPYVGTTGADIRAVQAWGVWKGAPNDGTGNVSEGNFRIAVIDSGVKYDHPDLYENIWLNQGEIPPSIRSQLTDFDGDGQITLFDLNHSSNQGIVPDVYPPPPLSPNGYIDAGDVLAAWSNDINEDGNDYTDDLVGWDFADGENDAIDDAGHGTHVSGTIGARGNNSEGVAGVMWRAQIVPLKFNPDPSANCGAVSTAIEAIQYCIDNNIKVINASWRTSLFCRDLYDVVSDAREHGVLLVAAAGNFGGNNDSTPQYPASFGWTHDPPGSEPEIQGLDNVIAVAASDNNDNRSVWCYGGASNYGAQSVHVSAPGSNILSTHTSSSYMFLPGTSMATPHVTGVAGLLWSRVPCLTHEQVRDHILSTVRPVSAFAPGGSTPTVTGGVVNAYEAVRWDCDGNCSPDNLPMLATEPFATPKSRFISFVPPKGSGPFAIEVKLTSLHHVDPPYTDGPSVPFTSFEGQSRWVGPPVQYVESNASGITFYAATLECTPHYRDWSTIDLLHVTGSAIVPSSLYTITALSSSCMGNESTCQAVSCPLEIKTARWGDVEMPFNPPDPSAQPNASDIGALVNKFRNFLGAPIKARALLMGNNNPQPGQDPGVPNIPPDFNFTHIAACVDAFRGKNYPLTIAACP